MAVVIDVCVCWRGSIIVITSTSVTTTFVSAVPWNDVTVEVTGRVLVVVESVGASVASLCLGVSSLEWWPG